ncbi:MAG: gas vesicle protein, partial [Desulfobacteraceae bacterium]|nr:gas vesicle protein [Desulfobacteraceae bacterium]
MTPQRNTNATLVDLLDRVLDKGLVIHADLIVSVAGIPLIGVNLRAALAGMETMLKYGMMREWDERSRAWEKEHGSKQEISLLQGEDVILKMLGACYSSEGIYAAWKYGYLYLTGERLLLYRENFGEVLFETPLVKIRGL